MTQPLDQDMSRPELVICDADYDLIANLALVIENRSPDLAGQLLQEIDRAAIVPRPDLPRNVVAMGSEVEFEDEANGWRRVVRLVAPRDADIEKGKVSILTSVGAGLIGMAAGRQICWPRPDGSKRVFRIVCVEQKPG